ncbi:MAG: nitroreductase family deazaflavin-dependent oxidoreductase [Chloroflexi bacterium]|nr:nitroreductase family deazaflavin-dependent oxidoreductase [Chloroflexota bacterium]
MYNRPGTLTRLSNRLMMAMASLGLGPTKMVTLEVRGRKSGRPRSTVVNVVAVDGQRYLVAPRGETEWARNARAAGEATLRRRGRRQVRLVEVPVEQRAPIIQAYLKENAMVTKAQFGIEPGASIEEFQRIAPLHPVFRIVDQ